MNFVTRAALTAGLAAAVVVPGAGAFLVNQGPDSSGTLRPVHELVEREIAAKDYSGVVALVARDGRAVHFEALGLMDVEGGKPMTRDAVFRLASMSKVVTAAAVLVLVEEGKLRLEDPVERYLPAFKDLKAAGGDAELAPAVRPITVLDLLTHTSGLGSGPASAAALAADPGEPGEDLAGEVARFARAPLDFQPGARWAYSGLAGFDTLGRVVEVVSGQDLERFMSERIFKPLGMTGTTFAPSPELRKRLATLYTREGGTLARTPDQEGFINPVCLRGAGGLVGTAEDYWRFAQMLANGGELDGKRVLGERMVAMLRSNHVPKGAAGLPAGVGFGLGVRVITDAEAAGTPLSTGAFGWSGAYGTHFWIDPARKIVAVYMANETNAGGAGAASARDFEKAVARSLVDSNE